MFSRLLGVVSVLGSLLVLVGLAGCEPINPDDEEVVCGDGHRAVFLAGLDPEECDDGNTIGGDGCSAVCKWEVCGNGVTDIGEECDDGNTGSGDGCDSECHGERECGNGIVELGEECDYGNPASDVGCDWGCQWDNECSNEIVEPGEECDDGNLESDDGCDSECKFECGNGRPELGELCDDGNRVDGDGCSSMCLWDSTCGDGTVEDGEECDDGNVVDGDGCDSMCRDEAPPLTEPMMSDDPLADFIDSISSVSAGRVSSAMDIVRYGAAATRLSAFAADFYFGVGGQFACGTLGAPTVICAPTPAPMPEGDVVRVVTEFQAPVPLDDPDNSYIYSAVIDSDGRMMNDWQFNVPFDWDIFQGADRWYQLRWNHGTRAWDMTVSQVDDGQNINPVTTSTARAVIEGNRVEWFLSASEFSAGLTATYRPTSFIHDGAFTEGDRGADVPGANPTEAMLTIDSF